MTKLTRRHAGGLVLALLALFVVAPFIGGFPVRNRVVSEILFAVVLAAAIFAESGHPRTMRIGLALAVPAAVLGGLAVAIESVWLFVSSRVLFVLALAYLLSILVRHLLRAKQVTTVTIGTAVAGYLVLGVAWSFVYLILAALDPTAISNVPEGEVGEAFAALLYFSFTTLTTLGYGDMAPKLPFARSMATLEAVCGQLYLAVTIARLVGLHIAAQAGQEEPTDPKS